MRYFLVVVLMLCFSMAGLAVAEASDNGKRDRTRFYGWVELMPETFHGTWVIGGHPITTDASTEFDEEEGPLMVGGCAKVDIRNGFVHEIDSEPVEDCR